MSAGEMRATRVVIQTTDSNLKEIEEAINAKRRKGSTMCEISIEALRHLHHDHLELLDGLRSRKLVGLILGDDHESIDRLFRGER